jgi:diphosphate--fructose-6-phosphate 1-phosphotransferase
MQSASGILSPRESGHYQRSRAESLMRMASPILAPEDGPVWSSEVSELQKVRRQYNPPLPVSLQKRMALKAVDLASCDSVDEKISRLVDKNAQEKLKELFPHSYCTQLVELVPNEEEVAGRSKPLRVGVVLSGGQAAGGHNVISGLFDYLMSVNPFSQLFGFLDGPKGIFTAKYKQVTGDVLRDYRNMGGFDLLGSGRDKIETEEQLSASMQTCMQLDLDGLVVIGGDDSNTNAAILAEYFKANACKTVVVGVPKTIDGDLKNSIVETSFGYDTACKTYSEEIGNICMDAASSKDLYAFIRLMGRSASHITLECALQTKVNMALIGEEVAKKNITLKQIVDEVSDLVIERKRLGKCYGVFLFPEGLIEFIPEVGGLIKELNEHQSAEKLCDQNKSVWDSLPSIIKEQLLLDRDPHGNVQVAKIATEQLLILMVEDELQRRLNCSEEELENWFRATNMYFGYEGRSCMPSSFDSKYCYSLGFTAGGLISSGLTGYMATVSDLHLDVSQWKSGGCPLVLMMTIERRKGKDKPVIKKYLVDLDGPQFKAFEAVRDQWKLIDCYCQVGPLQFDDNSINFMISAPRVDDLLPSLNSSAAGGGTKLWREQHIEWMSELQKKRLRYVPSYNYDLLDPAISCSRPVRLPPQEQQLSKALRHDYPRLVHETGNDVHYLEHPGHSSPTAMGSRYYKPFGEAEHELHHVTAGTPVRIGVVFLGLQSPGCENIVWGLNWRVKKCNGPGSKVVGFFGARGLVQGNYVELEDRDIELFKNQGGITMLGKDGGWGHADFDVLTQGDNMDKILKVCEEAKLNGLVMVGGPYTLTDAGLVAEYFLKKESNCRVIAVPATVNNNIRHPLIECSLGFHSASHAYASLVGNLLTDCASAKKYWYFVRLLSNDPSTSVLEASMQTNPHVTVISEECARQGKDIFDVVKEITDVVQSRHSQNKNWGVVLIPEGLISYLPSTRQLMKEITTKGADLSPWAKALLEALPADFEKQLFGAQSKSTGRFCLTHIKTEEIIAEMVKVELASRNKKVGSSFNFVTFFFGLLGRAAMPSDFDCSLGLSLGMLSGICVESGLTGVCTVAQRLCQDPRQWQLGALPLTSLMTLLGGGSADRSTFPVVPSTSVDILSKAYRTVRAKIVSGGTVQNDLFGNPGPMQMGEENARPKILLAEQGNLIKLNEKLLGYLKMIKDFACHGGLGLSESQLRTSVIHLKALTDILMSGQDETATALIQAYHENVMEMPTEQT